MTHTDISWPLAARLARRELRGGAQGFRIFVACLALGVAAIAAVGSTRAMLEDSISSDAREILGGDLLVDIVHRPASPEERAAMDSAGIVAASAEMRAMARAENEQAARTLVELKTVEGTYPLYGTLETNPPLPRDTLLAQRDGIWGVAAAPELLSKLGVDIGDKLRIGETRFEIRAAITHEPDRIGGSGIFSLGPRAMISAAALPDTALVQPGSLIHYNYRLRLPEKPAFCGCHRNTE